MSHREKKGTPTSSADAEKRTSHVSESLTSGRLPTQRLMELHELCLKKKIASTQGLVELYNSSEDEERRDSLLEWFNEYPVWFEENLSRHIEAAVIEEYVELANIKLRSKKDAKLVKRVFTSLCNRLHLKRYEEKDLVLSVARFLQAVDENIFGKDTTLLLNLAHDLLARLNPERNSFSKGNHEGHSATLFALHQIMFVLRRISPHDLNPSDHEGVYQAFKTNLDNLLEGSMYFPTRFRTRMVKEDLRLLESDSPNVMSSTKWRRVMHGLSGCAYIYRAVLAVLKADFDVDAIEKGYQRLKAACTDDRIERSAWCESLSCLNEAALIIVRDQTKIDILTDCSAQLLSIQRRMSDRNDQKLLRYGMVCQLHVLSVDGQTPEIRRTATRELVMIATTCVNFERWDHEEIAEAIPEAFCNIYHTKENTDLVYHAVDVMRDQATEKLQEIIDRWLDGRTMDQAFEKNIRLEDHQENNELLYIVQRRIGVFKTPKMTFETKRRSSNRFTPIQRSPG